MGKILIADDEPLILRILSIALKSKGYEVGTAEDGVNALHAAREQKPDLVISDVSMPGMDGLELARVVRQTLPGTRFILISGGTDFDDALIREQINHLDLVAAFKKPFNVAELFAAVDRALGNSVTPARETVVPH